VQQLSDGSVGTLAIGDELRVRRLGFGAARIARARGEDGAISREIGRSLVRRAVARGVNFIDVAALYAGGECEEIIAEAIHPYPDEVVIASKAGFVPAAPVKDGQAWPKPDGRPETIRSSCDDSLRRLRLDRIDLYQLHGPDPGVPIEDTLGAFAELRAEGKIREVGLSNVSLDHLVAADAIVPIVSVQNRYTPAHRDAEPLVKACEERDIAFIPYSANIVGDGPVAALLADIGDAHGVSPQQVCGRWLLHASPVMVPIPGTTQLDHVDDNVDLAWLELTDGELAQIDGVLG
jgi:pyridoxine 4-dehydrogenase